MRILTVRSPLLAERLVNIQETPPDSDVQAPNTLALVKFALNLLKIALESRIHLHVLKTSSFTLALFKIDSFGSSRYLNVKFACLAFAQNRLVSLEVPFASFKCQICSPLLKTGLFGLALLEIALEC